MASGEKQGASEHKQQKEVGDTVDLVDDLIPTHCCTQSDQSEVSMMATVCTEDTKELYVTLSSTLYKCIRTNSSDSSMASNESIPDDAIVTLNDDDCSDVEQQEAEHLDKREDPEHRLSLSLGATKQQPEPSSNDTTRAYQNDVTPSCRPNQKERILSPPTSTPRHHIRAKQLVSNHLKPAPIDHPWISQFAHYSSMDHNYPLFVAEEKKDQGGIGRELMGSHGQECQICWDGNVQCAFKPCGHARTCRSCSNYFLHQSCPFCRQLVVHAYEIHL